MKLAFAFPGQGAQSMGMLAGLAEQHPEVAATFAEASSVIDRDLWELAQNGPEQDLNRTDWTQPVILAAGYAVWRVWQKLGGPHAAFMAGHSLGEYSALVAAGALPFRDGVRLVHDRGKLMQAAVPEGSGAMAVILGLDDEQVAEICKQSAQDEVVEPANYNTPGQVVVAGSSDAVARAVENAKLMGARRAMNLSVSVPSHCSLMKPATENLAKLLQEVSIVVPEVPVIHNASAKSENSEDGLRNILVRQLYSPVRWVETIQNLQRQGVATIIECGPGKVLTGLNRRIAKGLDCLCIHDVDSLAKTLEKTV